MSEQTLKWTCPLCTYANWPRSPRCTVCQAPRDLPSIEDEMRRLDIGETVSKKLAGGGWVCPTCTFENWAASGKCTQCSTPSNKPSSSATSTSEQGVTPSSSLIQIGAVKWTCPACTYENWPKSKLCVMCKSPQGAATATPEAGSSNSDDAWHTACRAVVLGHDEDLQKLIMSAPQGIFLTQRLTAQDCITLGQWYSRSVASGETSPFRCGLTLIDLAQSCHRPDLVSLFLAISTSAQQHPQPMPPQAAASPYRQSSNSKNSPCQASPYAAKELRRHLDSLVRQRKGEFCCSYLTEFGVFALPAEVRLLSPTIQEVLIAELCDTEAQDGKIFFESVMPRHRQN